MAEFQTITCIPGLLNWTYIHNEGAAFGILQNQRTLFIVLTVVLVGACMALLFTKTARASRWVSATISLIVAGGIGNLIDRIRTGAVVDMISIPWFSTFNVADLFITFGAIILVLYIFIKDKEFLSDGPKKDKTDDADAEH